MSQPPPSPQHDLPGILRIARTPGIGPVTFRRLMLTCTGNVARIVENWEQLTRGKAQLAPESAVLQELEALTRAGGWIRTLQDADYPPQLAELPDAPIIISGLGNPAHLLARQVAIVGNRSASASGITWTRLLAAELARSGVTITSGLARGIDTAAHEGALHGGGATVAVVAGGVNHIYPPENAKLRSAIIENGCVISEQAWGMAPMAQLFTRRNRIIAGLAIGVAVSEATRHSGSLTTTEYALNYGRQVWAVPGSPADERSGGPNWLLKNGATLIENATDILADLPTRPAPYTGGAYAQTSLFEPPPAQILPSPAAIPAETTPLPARNQLFSLLGRVGTTFDELVRQTGQTDAELNALLVEMELEGLVFREPDGTWRKT